MHGGIRREKEGVVIALDVQIDGGRAGLTPGAGNTREVPEKTAERERERGRKSPGKPCCSSNAREDDPDSLLSPQPACCSL